VALVLDQAAFGGGINQRGSPNLREK